MISSSGVFPISARTLSGIIVPLQCAAMAAFPLGLRISSNNGSIATKMIAST